MLHRHTIRDEVRRAGATRCFLCQLLRVRLTLLASILRRLSTLQGLRQAVLRGKIDRQLWTTKCLRC
jgi:hypothetical protein